jgi:hypothetical protein
MGRLFLKILSLNSFLVNREWSMVNNFKMLDSRKVLRQTGMAVVLI